MSYRENERLYNDGECSHQRAEGHTFKRSFDDTVLEGIREKNAETPLAHR
jgi:hypothetical protein